MKKILSLITAAALTVGGFVIVNEAPADAQPVGNPGPVTLTIESGTLQIKTSTFEAGTEDTPITATGNIQPNGSITGMVVTFPPLPPIEDTPAGDVHPVINVLGTPTGSINPMTGVSTFSVTIEIRIPELGSGCEIGPITLNASSNNAGGVPYNTGTGLVTMSDHTFTVPGAQNCQFIINVDSQINAEIGLPSLTPGDNHAVLTASASPIILAGVRPAFVATPNTGFAPLNVNFAPTGTFTALPNPTYQWDFTNDGIVDSVLQNPSFLYAAPGNYTAKLRVTDSQGDTAVTTRPITVIRPQPDLTIDKTDSGSIVSGQDGTYTLAVSNVGSATTAAPITVTDTLPAGLDFVAGNGTGWICGAVGQDVTCTYALPVLNGESAPDITIDVHANGSVIGAISNTADVDVFDDDVEGNDTDTEAGQIVAAGIDLQVVKAHDGDLFIGEQAVYTVTVSNTGTLPAEARIRISDVLPADLHFVSASGGPTWICSNATAPELRCFTDDDLAPGSTFEPIVITTTVDDEPAAEITNTATVSVDAESNPGNDSGSDTSPVNGLFGDLSIEKSHDGDIVVGTSEAYSIDVSNVGTATIGGAVTVTDTLPAGLTLQSVDGGPEWTCDTTISCTHAGGIEPGDDLPGITVTVLVDSAALPSVSNTATLSVADQSDSNPENDSSTDTGDVRVALPDLTVTKSHSGNFTTGSNGTYTVVVRNTAEEATAGGITVTDPLPVGLSFVSAAGTGWSCGNVGPNVTCTRGDLAGFAIAPPLFITVAALDGAPAIVTNTATVSVANDTNAANNSSSDPTRIDRRPPTPTTMYAESIVLTLNITNTPSPLSLVLAIRDSPTAHLKTIAGLPVPGKLVTFSNLQGAVLCTAVTDAQGTARCFPTVAQVVNLLLGLRYKATFTGDLDYLGSSSEAALLHLFGGRLL